jgi:hypothetical protein
MHDIIPLEAVAERDTDLLLLEELSVTDGFVTWFLQKADVDYSGIPCDRKVWHSLSDPELGESDLVLLVKDDEGKRCALLIENKIDAAAQRQQAKRYRERGNRGIKDGDWEAFRTLIVAPEKYLQNDPEVGQYDAKLSYESIRDWFKGQTDASRRSRYKADLLEQAIQQNRRGYNPKMDERVTRFFHEYWLLAMQRFPELRAEDPGPRPASSIWISFRPDGLSKSQKIWHNISGHVDLELPFPASKVDKLIEAYSARLPKDVAIVRRGKSSGLRIKVPDLDRFQDLTEQESEALEGMKAALRLMTLVNVLSDA